MRGILADANCEGHVETLLKVLRSEEWREIWESLSLTTPSFADLGLPMDAPDRVVWQACQRERLVLVTGNRNAAGADSLEVVVRALNTEHSLPVITIATPDRVVHENDYAERAPVRLLERLLDIDHFRGAGRVYIP